MIGRMKFLITAPPATGKSTVIAKVLSLFQGPKGGVLSTEQCDASGKRIGFQAISESGTHRPFMTKAVNKEDADVGNFVVDLNAINSFVVPELVRAKEMEDGLIYVDEIGRAQALSPSFLETVRSILDTDACVLASVVYTDEPWSREFKRHSKVTLIEVTKENRERLPYVLVAAFENAAHFYNLDATQQAEVRSKLHHLLSSGQYEAAIKLFKNAVVYVSEGRVRKELGKFFVTGLTGAHQLEQAGDRWLCDCDLSNGKGCFAGSPEICSHQMAVELSRL